MLVVTRQDNIAIWFISVVTTMLNAHCSEKSDLYQLDMKRRKERCIEKGGECGVERLESQPWSA